MNTSTTDTISQGLSCTHCGDSCNESILNSQQQPFCCTGCRSVYQLLADNNMCDFYRMQEGRISKLGSTDTARFAHLDDEDLRRQLIDYEDAQQNYFYFGYNGQLNKHLVYASYYEHEEFLLIDHSTACIDTLNGRPYFSPNLKKVFSFYINPYEETEINGSYYSFVSDVEICIFFNNGSIKTIKHSFDFIPLEIRWKDDNTLLIKALSSEDYENVNGRLSEKTDCVYKRVTIK